MGADDQNGGDKTMIMAPSARAGHKQPAPRARLVCQNPDVLGSPAGQEILLDASEVSIGRSAEHDVSLKAEGISRNHAKFFPGDGAWGVEDLGSTNGVLVNGSKAQQAWLKSGDAILLGTVQYRYEFVQAAPVAEEPDAMREAEKTVVMRPTVKREVTAEAPTQPKTQAPKPAAQPARTQTHAPAGAARPAAARPAAARDKPSGSGSGMKLILVLALAVAAAVAFLVFK